LRRGRGRAGAGEKSDRLEGRVRREREHPIDVARRNDTLTSENHDPAGKEKGSTNNLLIKNRKFFEFDLKRP